MQRCSFFLILLSIAWAAEASPQHKNTTRVEMHRADARMRKLYGMWRIDIEAMKREPRFSRSLKDQLARFAVDYSASMSVEFVPPRTIIFHPTGESYQFDVSIESDESFRIIQNGLATEDDFTMLVRLIDDSTFESAMPVHVGPDEIIEHPVLYRRVFDPDGALAGLWRVRAEALVAESWFQALNDEKQAEAATEASGLSVTVQDDRRFELVAGNETIVGAARFGYVREGDASKNATQKLDLMKSTNDLVATLILRSDETDQSMLYLDERVWPLKRELRPIDVLLGFWEFDEASFRAMEWVQSLPADRREQMIRSKLKTYAEPQEFTREMLDEMEFRPMGADRFALIQHGEISFFLRIIDRDHLHMEAGYGRAYPLLRVRSPRESKP